MVSLECRAIKPRRVPSTKCEFATTLIEQHHSAEQKTTTAVLLKVKSGAQTVGTLPRVFHDGRIFDIE